MKITHGHVLIYETFLAVDKNSFSASPRFSSAYWAYTPRGILNHSMNAYLLVMTDFPCKFSEINTESTDALEHEN